MEDGGRDWKIVRRCSDCGQEEAIYVAKRALVFGGPGRGDAGPGSCGRCGSTTFTTAYEMPDLDFELLREWAVSPELYLMEQDEELLLAEEKYVDIILQVLDTVAIPESKRNVLLEALCVIVYDNTNRNNRKRSDALRRRVLDELSRRADVLRLADGSIMDYIKKVVYPQLGIGETE